jgi:hypothetical protein
LNNNREKEFDLWEDKMSNSQSEPPDQWPAAIITFGLSLTAAWVILLGYVLVRLIEHVI